MVLDEPKKGDISKEINEIPISFDSGALDFTENLTLDVEDNNLVLANPNSSC